MALIVNCANEDYDQFFVRTQEFPRRLQRHLRTELRDVARPALRDAQSAALALRLPAQRPARYPQERRSTGLRRGISNSVKLSLRDRGDTIEYRLRATHPMAEPTDAGHFRHPVFGNTDVWRGQESQRWWTNTMKRHQPRMRAAGAAALRKAVGEL
jgi:hypothetical protein